MPRNHTGKAGKVRQATPKVAKQEQPRDTMGRAGVREQYKKMFLSDELLNNGRQLSPNSYLVRKKKGLAE